MDVLSKKGCIFYAEGQSGYSLSFKEHAWKHSELSVGWILVNRTDATKVNKVLPDKILNTIIIPNNKTIYCDVCSEIKLKLWMQMWNFKKEKEF